MFFLRRPELYAAVFVVAVALGRLAAQEIGDGALHGVVQDAGGHAIPGAIVSLTGEELPPRGMATDADGTFVLPHLAPGAYAVMVLAPGYLARPSAMVVVAIGDDLELHATVRPIGSTIFISRPQVAAPEPPPDEDGDGLTSLHGLVSTQNSSVIDGVDANQSFHSTPAGAGSDPAPDPDGDADSAERTTGPANGLARGRHAGVAYVFAQSAVREFRVAGRGYSAATGHAGGDVATTVSRGGTEEFHGSLLYALRSQALAAHDPLAVATSYLDGAVTSVNVKPHDLRQTFGLALAGPIPLRGVQELVFFYDFDLQRRGFPAIASPADPNFYNLTATQKALLANRGVGTAAVNASLNYLSSLTGATPRRADQTLHFGRIDWHLRPRLTLAAEYNRVRWTSPAGLIDAPVVARGRASLGNASGSLDLVLLRATSDFGAHLSNQAHIAFLRDQQYESPQTPLAQEPAIVPGGSGFNLAPEVNIGPNGLLFGTPATLSQQAYPDERRVQIADTLTLVRGHHAIEVGGDVAFIADRVATLANAAGTFHYDSGTTKGFAGGLVDFLTDQTFNVHTTPNGGCPAITAVTHLFCFRSFSQSFGESSVAFSTAEFAGFAQDTWRPRAGLTIQAGVRYEYTLLPIPASPNTGLDALFGSRGATSIFPEDRNNLGPRAAISWEPLGAGRGVVRVGYGVFFGRLPGATIQAALSDTALAATTTRIRIQPSAGVACPQVPAQGFGYPCAFLAQPAGVVASTTSAVVFDRRFRLPVVEQGSLSLERTIFRRTSISATYVLNLDRQLPDSTDLNIAPSTSTRTFQLQGGVFNGETFLLPFYTARVSPSFGPVTDVVSNGNATYNGLALVAQSHALKSLAVRAEYTWSKALDFGQNQSATPRTNGQFDPFTNGYDKGRSSLDYPWLLRTSAVWTPRSRNRLADGWELTPIVAAHSGRPYSYDISGGTLLPGGHESINGSGGALYLPTVGRNTLRLPATVVTHVRVGREFQAARVRIRASVEALNLFNHRNVSSVQQRAFLLGTAAAGVTPLVFQDAATIAAEGLNTQAFGTPTAASTSVAQERHLQFQVRVGF